MEDPTMADFWRDLVLTAMRNMSVTLGTVLPSILAMLTLVILGAVLGWIAGTLVARLAPAPPPPPPPAQDAHAIPAAPLVRAADPDRRLARRQLPRPGDADHRGQRGHPA